MIYRILILSLVLFSCTDGIPRYDKPVGLIPRDKMVELMTELSKLEAHIQAKYVGVDKYHNAMKLSGDSLMNAHNYKFEDFEVSLSYYASRQDEVMSIYSDVLNELNKDLGEIEESRE